MFKKMRLIFGCEAHSRISVLSLSDARSVSEGEGKTRSAILMVTRSAEVVGSTSDEATGVLTWLLRTCPFAHSDCSKVGDEKYVTGKYPAGE
ncbi:hypothetical protein QLX08_005783 [Tetragonisca angustula]|uniref:Uncharacterized protein n=1 Tax=Tetragonisca angustula TaxID=166442 RepID=A0AAW0ZWS4_9HYME